MDCHNKVKYSLRETVQQFTILSTNNEKSFGVQADFPTIFIINVLNEYGYFKIIDYK